MERSGRGASSRSAATPAALSSLGGSITSPSTATSSSPATARPARSLASETDLRPTHGRAPASATRSISTPRGPSTSNVCVKAYGRERGSFFFLKVATVGTRQEGRRAAQRQTHHPAHHGARRPARTPSHAPRRACVTTRECLHHRWVGLAPLRGRVGGSVPGVVPTLVWWPRTNSNNLHAMLAHFHTRHLYI